MTTDFKYLIEQLLQNKEFQKLELVGGHTTYHLEGDALAHTLLVAEFAKQRWGKFSKMHLVALLHDVGKITHHVKNGENDFSYPHHADGGANELGNFIPEDIPEFNEVRWYVYNHIRPMFWDESITREEAKAKLRGRFNDQMFDNLIGLVICDLKGSMCIPEVQQNQDKKIKFLESLIA